MGWQTSEALELFKVELSKIVGGDPTLEVLAYDGYKKFTTEQLKKAYSKTKENLGAKELIEDLLAKRGEPVQEEKEKQEPAEPREYKKCLSAELLQERLAKARLNYHKVVEFVCTKDKQTYYGIIRSARLDKRSGFIQYRIEILAEAKDNKYTATGKIYGKGDDSKNLTIYDEAPIEIASKEKEENPVKGEEA